MSGKNKQRTKGNVKPSSSGRTAQLLERDGGGAISFVGFGAMSGDLGYVPSIKAGEDQDGDLDNDLRITMRKMTKKDSVTKLKAIQEFGEYCQTKDETAVLGALPHFPRIYNRLVLDADKRIREATQHAFQHLVVRAGRNLAPHLKQLMGSWLLSQCDSYPPCALGAKMAFKQAFTSEEKRRGSVGFCFKEVLAYVEANLLVETAATLTDPKTLSPVEQKDRYIEVVASSILSLKTCIDLLPDRSVDASGEALEGLLRHDKLWKLGKHESPQVRSAFLAMLKGLCEKFPSAAEEFLPKMTPLILGRLDDTDSTVASNLWQAVLVLISRFPTCWAHVNLQKAVLPKIWSLLKQGGGGVAYIIFPNLLPLLSHLPPDVMDDRTKFYRNFFEKLKLGLDDKDLSTSSGEESAILKTYIECLHYAASVSVKDNAGVKEFLTFILLEELLPLLEETIKGRYTQSSTMVAFTQTSSFMAYLSRNSPSESSVADVLREFWQKLTDFCVGVLREDTLSQSHIRNLVALVADLNSPGQSEALYKKLVRTGPTERQARVTFSPKISYRLMEEYDEEQAETESHPSEDGKGQVGDGIRETTDPVNSIEKDSMMLAFVEILLECSWSRSGQEPEQLAFIADVQYALRSYKGFYTMMLRINDRLGNSAQGVSEGIGMDGADKMDLEGGASFKAPQSEEMQFLDVLVSRVSGIEWKGEENDRTFEILLEMMLQTIVQCPVTERPALLESALTHLHSMNRVASFMTKVKSFPEESLRRQCYSSPQFAEALVTLTSDLCEQSMAGSGTTSRDHWGLVGMAFETDADDKPYLDIAYAERILCVIYQTLQAAHSDPHPDEAKTRTVNLICDVAASFFSSVKTCIHMPAAEDLLVSLFQLSCRQDSHFSVPLKNKVEKSWRCGLEGIVKATGGFIKPGGLLEKVAGWIKTYLFQKKGNLESIQGLARATCAVCQILHQTLPHPGEVVEVGAGDVKTSPTDGTRVVNNVVEAFIKMVTYMGEELSEYASLLNDQNFTTLLLRGTMTFDPSHLYPSDLHNTTCYITHALFICELMEAMYPDGQLHTSQFAWPSTLRSQWILDVSLARAWCEVTLGCENEIALPKPGAVTQSAPGVAHQQTLSEMSDVLTKVMRDLSEEEWKMLLLQARESLTYYLAVSTPILATRPLPLLKDLVRTFEKIAVRICRTKENSLAGYLSLRHLLRDFHAANDGYKVDVLAMCGGFERLASLSCMDDLQTLECILPWVPEPHVLLQCHTAVLMTTDPLNSTSLSESFFSLSAAGACIPFVSAPQFAEVGKIFGTLISYLMQLRETDSEDCLYLFECSLDDASSTAILVNIKIMQLLTNMVSLLPSSLETEHWDFIMCSLVSWCHTCTESLLIERTNLHTAFHTAAFNFLSIIADLMSKVTPDNSQTIPPDLTTEWKEFFAGGIYDNLLSAYVHCAGRGGDLPQTSDIVFLRSFSSAISQIPADQVKSHMLPARLIPGFPTFVPDEMQTLLNTFCALMELDDRGVVISAAKVLQKVMPDYAQCYEEGSRKTSDNTSLQDDEIIIPPPKPLLDIITLSESDLEELLGDVPVGDYIMVGQSSEGYQTCLRYLLSWQLFLCLFESTKTEVRAEFAAYLKRTDFLSALLRSLFKLMPTNPTIKTGSPAKKQGKQEPSTLFSKPLDHDPNALYAPSRDIPHLAASVYLHALQVMPALIRQWWSDQDRRIANIVDRYTTSYVSPLLCSRELKGVNASDHDSENMTVVARVNTREVVATYSLQDLSIELVITLPTNYPLGVITVESGKKVGVGAAQWRNWMLQLTTYLTKQNGTIMDGLELWRRNVDKKFEGIEECTVCFSVIHGANCSLPKIPCRTCKKKFHSACLYKWFKSSNQSSCPLCRSPF